MSLSTSQNAPEFGLMRLDGSEWVLDRPASFGDRVVQIRVETTETVEITPLQRTAIRQGLSLSQFRVTMH